MRPDLMQTQPLKSKSVAVTEQARPGERVKLEIPVGAQVECNDGACGRSVYVLINPVTEMLTHLVVRENSAPHTEFVVPIESVAGTTAGTIQLNCSLAELAGMEPFIQTEYIENKEPREDGLYDRSYATGQYFYWPYVGSEITNYEPVQHQEIPLGEMTVRRGTRVEAIDGPVGHVDEFVLNSKSGHISHLVMREGHAWAPRDVIIPISALDNVRQGDVHLKLDKHEIEALPNFPVKRRWA